MQRLIESGPHKGKPALTKCEALTTRRCPYRCAGCSMYRADEKGRNDYHQSDLEEAPMERWYSSLDQLSLLGCGFIAQYGAEPAQVPERTAQFIDYASNVVKIPNTVITSGVGLSEDMISYWWDRGLRSLTMSVDAIAGDELLQASNKSSRMKTLDAYKFLKFWTEKYGKHSEYRDAEGCMTLTRKNYKVVPTLIRELSALGVWLHFDLVHADRGQPYSKVETVEDIGELMFRSEDYSDLRVMLAEVKAMKDDKYLIHPSKGALDMVGSVEGLTNQWQCCKGKEEFIGMVTMDVNCVVRPCDDFLPPEMDVPKNHPTASPQRKGMATRGGKLKLLSPEQVQALDVESTPIFGWEISDRWDEYRQRTKEMVRKYDCHCSWVTHMQAEQIYAGVGEDLEHYIHTRVADLPTE